MDPTETSPDAGETEYNENAPLLATSPSRHDEVPKLLPRWTRMQWRVMLIAAFLMFSANLGNFMGLPPQIKIFEDIICENYKRSLDQKSFHRINGDVCQSEVVQNELALVTGWKNTLDVLPGT